jgi:hypothetical protein
MFFLVSGVKNQNFRATVKIQKETRKFKKFRALRARFARAGFYYIVVLAPRSKGWKKSRIR